MNTLRIGTRASPLALKQTALVQAHLERAPAFSRTDFTTHAMTTTGDRITDRPLYEEGGKGLFVKELEEALLDGRIDLAVNSLKDVESDLNPAFTLAAYLPREDARDVLITREGNTLEALAAGALIGTCSPRRITQLLQHRPDVAISPIRGNLGTRLSLLSNGQVDGLILAAAGLKRLNITDFSFVYLDPQIMLPACGQGILTIECLKTQEQLCTQLATVTDLHTALCAEAERALLQTLGGSCRTPIGAHASILPSGAIHLSGMLALHIGQPPVYAQGEGTDPLLLGQNIGHQLRHQLASA